MNEQKLSVKSAIDKLAAKIGYTNVICLPLLFIGWFILSTATVNVGFGSSLSLSLWKITASGGDMSGFMNGGSSFSFYSLLLLIGFFGPVYPFYFKDIPAKIGNALPLIYILLFLIIAYMKIKGLESDMNDAFGRNSGMAQDLFRTIHLGAGFYLGLIVSIYLTIKGLKK